MAGIQTPEEAAKLRELEESLDFLKERKMAEEDRMHAQKKRDLAMTNAKVESDPQNPLLASPRAMVQDSPKTAAVTAAAVSTPSAAAISAPSASAVSAPSAATTALVPAMAPAASNNTAASAAADTAAASAAAPLPAASGASSAEQSGKEAAASDTADNENGDTLPTVTKISEMSALDRARASRFAPPKHILEKAGGIKPLESSSDNKDNTDTTKPEKSVSVSTNSRGGVAPAITPPKEVARPQTMTATPKPLSPKPVSPHGILKGAMSADEAQRQGVLAPGTYEKKDDNKDSVSKGDTREIPNVGKATDISAAADAKETPKTVKNPEPIKNPLPIPRKHESKDMDFDHHVANLDMHFDVVDMSGIDFFDIN